MTISYLSGFWWLCGAGVGIRRRHLDWLHPPYGYAVQQETKMVGRGNENTGFG